MAMKLMTKAIERKLPRFNAGQHDPVAVCKFFTPDSNWTWYAVEGERQPNGDLLMFGLVFGFEKEWGYFSLREIQEARGPMGLHIERDLYFMPTPIDVIEKRGY